MIPFPRPHVLALILALAGLATPPGAAATARYRTVTPRVGDPFEVIQELELIEPLLAGTGEVLPGWRGEGHIIRLRDGRLLAAYAYENRCYVAYSSDQALSWTSPQAIPITLAAGAQTHRPAVIETRGGVLWVFYYELVGRDVQNPRKSVNPLWAIRSLDHGRTWGEARRIHDGYVGMLQGAIETRQGHLVVPICVYGDVFRYFSRCVVSVDAGASWKPTEFIDIDNSTSPFPLSPRLSRGAIEPSVAELPDGRLLMLIRSVIGSFYQTISSDGGLTWGAAQPTILSCGGPGNLVRAADEQLVFTYNPASFDNPGTKRTGSPIGYDRESIALDGDGVTWNVVDDFVRQIPGRNRVVHSTVTDLGDGRLLITMPERSCLLVGSKDRLRHQTRKCGMEPQAARGASVPRRTAPHEISTAGPVRLVLPPVIHAVPGIECNIYFDNIVLVGDAAHYNFEAVGDRGEQLDERWTFTPSVNDTGEHSLEIIVRDDSNHALARASVIIRVAPLNGAPAAETTVLLVGDSLTQAAIYPQHLLDLDAQDEQLHLKLIGCRGPGNAPPAGLVRFEGYNGWTAEAYATSRGPFARTGWFKPGTGSPFVYDDGPAGPGLDFTRYCREFNEGRGPDAITIQLGTNDVFSATDDTIDARLERMLGFYDQLITAFHRTRPDTEVGIIMTLPPAHSQDGFRGYKGARRQTRWQYRRNIHRTWETLVRRYAGRERDHIHLLPVYLNIDVDRHFPRKSAPANARTEQAALRVSDGIHPSAEAYRQSGDAIYCWLKSLARGRP